MYLENVSQQSKSTPRSHSSSQHLLPLYDNDGGLRFLMNLIVFAPYFEGTKQISLCNKLLSRTNFNTISKMKHLRLTEAINNISLMKVADVDNLCPPDKYDFSHNKSFPLMP